jgi:hypothetical protein
MFMTVNQRPQAVVRDVVRGGVGAVRVSMDSSLERSEHES